MKGSNELAPRPKAKTNWIIKKLPGMQKPLVVLKLSNEIAKPFRKEKSLHRMLNYIYSEAGKREQASLPWAELLSWEKVKDEFKPQFSDLGSGSMKNSGRVSPERLLILCCHCVYHQGNIYGKHPEDKPVYERHLRESIKVLQEGHYDILIISGGFTRRELKPEKSEAQGMLDWARDLNLDTSRIILEEYARDSFENVLFSMCRFFQEYKRFPSSVGICSWKFKERRFNIMADALRLPDYSFLGVGENEKASEGEAKLLDSVIDDPFHRKPSFAHKRQERDPWNKGNPYSEINEFKGMFVILDLMEEKEVTDCRLVDLPWTSNKKQEPRKEEATNPDRTQWSTVYEQHWLHARHVENERLWFTNVFTIVVAALLAVLATIWKMPSPEGTLTYSLDKMTLLIGAVIFGLALIGSFILITWRAPFIEHTTLANKMLEDEPKLRKYRPYQSNEFQKIKWPFEIKAFHLFTAHTLFYLFFVILGVAGSFILLIGTWKGASWWLQILIPLLVFTLFMIPWIRYEKREKEFFEGREQRKY